MRKLLELSHICLHVISHGLAMLLDPPHLLSYYCSHGKRFSFWTILVKDFGKRLWLSSATNFDNNELSHRNSGLISPSEYFSTFSHFILFWAKFLLSKGWDRSKWILVLFKLLRFRGRIWHICNSILILFSLDCSSIKFFSNDRSRNLVAPNWKRTISRSGRGLIGW